LQLDRFNIKITNKSLILLFFMSLYLIFLIGLRDILLILSLENKAGVADVS
jgi:hypothetical protein